MLIWPLGNLTAQPCFPAHPCCRVLQGSYTVSPLDPKARLFYNPAFNDELRASAADPQRAAYMPLSARGASAGERPPVPLPRSKTARGWSEVGGWLPALALLWENGHGAAVGILHC